MSTRSIFGRIFDNIDLNGKPITTRCDSKIGLNSPSQETINVNNIELKNNWSVRWSGKFNFEKSSYEFAMKNDEGGRLFIDGNKVIDSWKEQNGSIPNLYKIDLNGVKEIKMEYYQKWGGYVADLSWQKIDNSNTSSSIDNNNLIKKTGYLRYSGGVNQISKDKIEPKHIEEKWSFIDIETKKEVYVKIPETLIKSKGGAYYLTKDKVEISYSEAEWGKALKDPKFLLNIIDIKPLGLPVVDPLLGNNTSSDFWMGQYADKIGSKKYAAIMCKFADVSTLPITEAKLSSIINGNSIYTLQDYFKKSSFDKLDFTADVYGNKDLWYTLPQPESFYLGPNFTSLRDDCINAANKDIDFTKYDGIIHLYNGEEWDDGSAWGGPSNWLFLDGQWKPYGVAYIPPWVYQGLAWFKSDFGAFAHEIGHSFGLPHSNSTNPDGSINEYGSRWDLMSDSRVLINGDARPTDLIAYYKDRLGWIEDNKRSRILTSNSANPRVIEIESNSNPSNNSTNFQLAYVKDNSNLPGTSQFETYSIESRFFKDYDQNLQLNNLQESIVIHRIDSFGGSDRRAILVTSLTAQNGNNNFTTNLGNLNIRVCEKKTTSFVVAVNSVCPGSIGDQVWEDLNNNVKDTNENGVNGVTVNLVGQTGQTVTDINNQPIPTQTTRTVGTVQGFYQFTNLRPGSYKVRFSNLNGFNFLTKTGNLQDPNNSDVIPSETLAQTDTFTITAGQNINYIDAGVRKKGGILGNKVWEDLNGNNLQDVGEHGINGVIVSLTDQNGQPVRDVNGVIVPNQTTATVSGEQGIYNFSNLHDSNSVNVGGQALRYIVKFSNIPANMKPVTKTGNAADKLNSDINPNLQTDPLALLFWETSQGTIDFVDAGLVKNSVTFGNKVWEDLNGNNLQDVGEPGVNGVTVNIRDNVSNLAIKDINGQNVPDQITKTVGSESGIYTFSNLKAGTYKLIFSNIPSGTKFANKIGDLTNANNSDVNPTNGTTDAIIIKESENINHIDVGIIRNPTLLLGWGGNYAGVLGTGNTNGTATPIPIINGKDTKKVVTNGFSTIILKNNGEVWTTGMNNCGWLGNGKDSPGECGQNNGSPADISTPVKITFGNNLLIKDIAQTFAIDQNGNVWAWSIPCINGRSPLENGCNANINQGIPRRILSASGVLLNNMAEFNTSMVNSYAPRNIYDWNINENRTFAVDNTGNQWDLLGDYTKSTLITSSAPSGFAWNLVTKTSGSYTLLKDGRLFEIVNNAPVQVKPGTTFKDIAVSRHVLALETSGRVWTKGFNICGQLGIGGTFRPIFVNTQPTYTSYNGCWDMGINDHAANPPVNDFVLVKDSAGTGILSNIKSVNVNDLQSMAITNDGKIYVWGGDRYGIGLATIRQTGLPILIPNVSKVQQIVTNRYHNLLIIQD